MLQDHSAIKRSDPTTLQNQEKQENQDLRTTTQVPSLPDQSQEDGSATSSGRNGANGTPARNFKLKLPGSCVLVRGMQAKKFESTEIESCMVAHAFRR